MIQFLHRSWFRVVDVTSMTCLTDLCSLKAHLTRGATNPTLSSTTHPTTKQTVQCIHNEFHCEFDFDDLFDGPHCPAPAFTRAPPAPTIFSFICSRIDLESVFSVVCNGIGFKCEFGNV